MWNKDFMHPIDAGHKAIADVVVYAIQQSALQLAMSPYGVPDLDLLLEPLPAPMFPGNYEGKNRLCVYGEVRVQQWFSCNIGCLLCPSHSNRQVQLPVWSWSS